MAVLVKHRFAELAYLFAEVGVGVGGNRAEDKAKYALFVIIYSTAYTCTGTYRQTMKRFREFGFVFVYGMLSLMKWYQLDCYISDVSKKHNNSYYYFMH